MTTRRDVTETYWGFCNYTTKYVYGITGKWWKLSTWRIKWCNLDIPYPCPNCDERPDNACLGDEYQWRLRGIEGKLPTNIRQLVHAFEITAF